MARGILRDIKVYLINLIVLAWIMPKQFKNFFNRGFNPLKEEEMSEDDLMTLIRQQREEGLPRGNY